MRLISCYIENFGNMSKFTYDFCDGLNIIEEENGWGKTTLASFIKAMFYGLEYKTGKTITERKRYMPWNGNKFGGYIIIEKDGTQYKIERFFGKRDKDDTFTVYDMSRNIASGYLGENPGEEIWKVDRESFEKTAFITLNDSSLLNDIISSKLGNIKDQEADLESSTKAVKLLENEMIKIKAKRGNGGIIGTKTEKITYLKSELKECNNSLTIIEQTEEWIRIEKNKLQQINNELAKIEEEQSNIILYEKKRQYLELKNDYETRKIELDKIKVFFKGEVLSEEALKTIKDETGRFINQKELAYKNQLSQAQKDELEGLTFKFKNGLPKPSEIEECNKRIAEFSNKKTELKSYSMTSEDKNSFTKLENKYGKLNLESDVIDGYLNDFSQVSALKAEENSINVELGKLDNQQENIGENARKGGKREKRGKGGEIKTAPLLLVGISVLLLGLLLGIESRVVGGGIAIAGFIIAILSFLFISKGREETHLPKGDVSDTREKLRERLKLIEQEKVKIESGYLTFLKAIDEHQGYVASSLANCKVEISEYKRLKKQIFKNAENEKQAENEISILKEQIEFFLAKYCNVLLINDYEKSLLELRMKLASFDELSRIFNSHESAVNFAIKSKDFLIEKLALYYQEFPNDVATAVNEITNKYYALETAKSKLKDSKAKLEKFGLENDISSLDQIELPEGQNNQLAEELREQKKDLDKKKDEIVRTIERHKKDVNELSQKADKMEDLESTIMQLDLDLEEYKKQYELINLAKECMMAAKENLATKYMGNMSNAFRKYLKELNNEKTDTFQIDINLNVSVEHEGELHDSSELSKGMKDLIQVCMRMALVEAVYKDTENPILILDDPFVNLDNNRLENAIKLLGKISTEYQIIYFICHNSRSV